MAYNYGYPPNPYMGFNQQIPQQQTQPQVNVNGYVCRPVTSREEALATPCDFMAAGVIMPDLAHGMIYVKRFNAQTGASDFGDFVFTQPAQPKENAEYTPKADFDKLCGIVNGLQAELAKMREVKENAEH